MNVVVRFMIVAVMAFGFVGCSDDYGSTVEQGAPATYEEGPAEHAEGSAPVEDPANDVEVDLDAQGGANN